MNAMSEMLLNTSPDVKEALTVHFFIYPNGFLLLKSRFYNEIFVIIIYDGHIISYFFIVLCSEENGKQCFSHDLMGMMCF